uniref:Uncharacterized protein n=1 Tax=Capra hircus TaxID=9925 RepID=A0A8C2S775_CAPHI
MIPIVATTSTPGIARNSKKRPASPSHNGSSAGGYSASKKKKASASGFAQVRCHAPNLRVRGSPPLPPVPRGCYCLNRRATSSRRSLVWSEALDFSLM